MAVAKERFVENLFAPYRGAQPPRRRDQPVSRQLDADGPAIGLVAQPPQPRGQFRAQVEFAEEEPRPRPQAHKLLVELARLIGAGAQPGGGAEAQRLRQAPFIAALDIGAHAHAAGLPRVVR